MKRIAQTKFLKTAVLLFVLAFGLSMVPGASAQSPFPYAKPFQNDPTTGTTQFTLTKINSSGNAIIMATSDTNGYAGVCVANCGKSGTAWVAFSGLVPLIVDATTTIDHYIQISSTTGGDGHDSGATSYPITGGDVIGRVQSASTGAASVSIVDLFAAETVASSSGGAANPLCTDFPAAGAWSPTTLVSGHVYCPTANATYTTSGTPISWASDSYIVCPNQSTIIQGTSASTDIMDAGNAVHRWGMFNCTVNDGGVIGGYLLHANSTTGNDDVILQNILWQAPTRTNSRNGLVRFEGGKNIRIVKYRFTGPILDIGLNIRTDQAIMENFVNEDGMIDFAETNDSAIVYLAPASNNFVGGGTRDITCNMMATNANGCIQSAVQLHSHHIENLGCYITAPIGGWCGQIFSMYAGGMNHLWLYVNVGAGGAVDSGTIGWKLGDMYGATLTDIKCDGGGKVKACLQLIDGDGYIVDGVNALGMNQSGGTNAVQVNIGSNFVNNTHATLKNINVQWVAGTVAGSPVSVVLDCTGAGSGHNCDNNIFDGLNLSGGQAGITAVKIVAPPAGVTTSHTQIRNVMLDGAFGTGFSIGTGVIGTTIEGFKAPATTTILSDSGTDTQVIGHTTKLATATLSSGTVSITLANDDVFASSSTYLCKGSDQTTPTNALSFTYTSGTAFTITGTGSDVIRYQCQGY